ncbi:MAG: hypothetical protein D6814_04665 [Calditrichaeota bacterium]|nr:MAG: hypothetical protein D6814_04665 [Calditrichota bacterium]
MLKPGKIVLLFLLFAGLCLSASCGIFSPDAYEHLIIMTDNQTYSPGDTLQIAMVNFTARAIEYNLCLYSFQILKNQQWMASLVGKGHVCQLPAFLLKPGDIATYRIPLTEPMEPGIYRLKFSGISQKNGGPLPEKHRVSNRFIIVNE